MQHGEKRQREDCCYDAATAFENHKDHLAKQVCPASEHFSSPPPAHPLAHPPSQWTNHDAKPRRVSVAIDAVPSFFTDYDIFC